MSTFYPKNLEKQEQIKSKTSRTKKTIEVIEFVLQTHQKYQMLKGKC